MPRLQIAEPIRCFGTPSSAASSARVLRLRCHSRIAAICFSVSLRLPLMILSPLEYGRIARTRGSAWRSAAVQTRATARLAERLLREGLDSENAMRHSRVQGEPAQKAPPLQLPLGFASVRWRQRTSVA